eukprot:4922347-Heterocapsa_arctica.AAC.1
MARNPGAYATVGEEPRSQPVLMGRRPPGAVRQTSPLSRLEVMGDRTPGPAPITEAHCSRAL